MSPFSFVPHFQLSDFVLILPLALRGSGGRPAEFPFLPPQTTAWAPPSPLLQGCLQGSLPTHAWSSSLSHCKPPLTILIGFEVEEGKGFEAPFAEHFIKNRPKRRFALGRFYFEGGNTKEIIDSRRQAASGKKSQITTTSQLNIVAKANSIDF